MNELTTFFKDFLEDESGLTAVEYAVAGGLVVAGMVTAFTNLGTAATGQIEALCTAVGASGATCT
ncbi:Flp family type IVb pilin [Moritella sp. 24]|uniref:Flp family type IVb pilin n=1 Tax=Moritella sp. 24 TaxID=2746230 RepID=UPI001BA8503F|nr:Flp family type IVb pilin [Moritella sp. 24]QUM76585.1 Flp family type IVb pilin [Moritella sp. 24]